MAHAGKRRKIGRVFYTAGVMGVITLNLVAWKSTRFCDWYVAHVFPVWLNTYGRLTSAVPFSVGEWMLILAVCLIVFGIGFFIYNLIRRGRHSGRLLGYGRGCAWLALAVCVIMTLNCFILYHASGFAAQYMNADTGHSAYTKSNLAVLRQIRRRVPAILRLSQRSRLCR